MKDIYRSFENFENERYLLRPSEEYLIGEDGEAYNGYWKKSQV